MTDTFEGHFTSSDRNDPDLEGEYRTTLEEIDERSTYRCFSKGGPAGYQRDYQWKAPEECASQVACQLDCNLHCDTPVDKALQTLIFGRIYDRLADNNLVDND